MPAHLVSLCGNRSWTNRVAGRSAQGYQSQPTIVPGSLRPCTPARVPAAFRPARLACDCPNHRPGLVRGPSLLRPVGRNVLCSHRLGLTPRWGRLRSRCQDGLVVRHARGSRRRSPVQPVAPPLERLKLSVAAVHQLPDRFLASRGLPVDSLHDCIRLGLAFGGIPVEPPHQEFELPLPGGSAGRPDAQDQRRKRDQYGRHRQYAADPLWHVSAIYPPATDRRSGLRLCRRTACARHPGGYTGSDESRPERSTGQRVRPRTDARRAVWPHCPALESPRGARRYGPEPTAAAMPEPLLPQSRMGMVTAEPD